MIVISRYLGRMEPSITAKASCCLWQPEYYIRFRTNVKENFLEKVLISSGSCGSRMKHLDQYFAVLTLMPGPMVEAMTQLRIY